VLAGGQVADVDPVAGRCVVHVDPALVARGGLGDKCYENGPGQPG
jgi:hypothetical protein